MFETNPDGTFTLFGWVCLYVLGLFVWRLINYWGGAELLERVDNIPILGWFLGNNSAEPTKLAVTGMMIIFTIWFVVGVFVPEARVGARSSQ